MFDTAIQDFRYACRGLARNPLFAVTAVIAGALGVGATTAVFSVVDRILFRALPYRNEHRLVSVGMLAPLDTNEFMFAVEYFDLRHDAGPFEAVTSFQAGAIDCDLTEDNPLRLRCMRVESNFLETFGIAPHLGRSFTRDEDRPNGARVVMISHGLWRSRFAGDPDVVGRTLPIDGEPHAIVGVLPADFEMPTLTRADILFPENLNEAMERQGRALRVFGRLKPGLTIARATAELGPHYRRALEQVPLAFRKEIRLRVQPVRDRQVGNARLASSMLFGAVLAVLLIACANITNLLLARAVARDREIAVRIALGASRPRLIRQTLTESLVLGALGGAAGCGVAYGLLRILIAIAPGGLPWIEDASLDGRVLMFALAAAVASGLVFGLAPAMRSPGVSTLGATRSTRRGTGGLRTALVTIQVAFSMMLLTGAGLLLSSLSKLQRVPLGMQSDHVLTAHFVLGKQRYAAPAAQISFFNRLEQAVAAVPGVTVAAISDSVPPYGHTRARPLAAIDVLGRPRRPEGTGGMVTWRYVTPNYFHVLGIPLLRGRPFRAEDRYANSSAVILSDTLAQQLFPGEDAVGKRILRSPQGQWSTVIGVAGDVKNAGPGSNTAPEYYLLRKPAADFVFQQQEPPTGWREGFVVARTAIDPAIVSRSLRTAIGSLDATLPVETETMPQRLQEITQQPRFNAILLGVFALIGLTLAAIGLFGVMSFLVAQRTREIGVRMALGATPAQVLFSMLRQSAQWTAAGMFAGLLCSMMVARFIRSLLFQVEPSDPFVIGGAVLILFASAMIAAAVPASRAAHLDPIETLRQE